MKKSLFIIAILSILLSFTISVSADTIPKDIEVVLSDSAAVVNIGDNIALSATSIKHGSFYTDKWDNAIKSITEYDPITESYISSALFIAEKPGVYTISYTIKMTAGDSDTVFTKTVERIIEVVDPHTVTGADIRDLEITPIYNTDGSISVYRAFGTIYALWSDNTATPQGSLYFFFNPSETTKNVDVTFNIDGKPYTYTVTVNR